MIGRYPAGDTHTALRIAASALAGEIALRGDRPALAVTYFREAVTLEDALTYNEPPTWYYPMRHSFGLALLAAGRPVEAERAYREDLARFPANGWSLVGLGRALAAQGKHSAAERVRRELAVAWRGADVVLSQSRF